jgi:hypothetical protein
MPARRRPLQAASLAVLPSWQCLQDKTNKRSAAISLRDSVTTRACQGSIYCP